MTPCARGLHGRVASSRRIYYRQNCASPLPKSPNGSAILCPRSESIAEMDARMYYPDRRMYYPDRRMYYPDRRTSRFMSLTGCNESQARFCLEATGFDFQKATDVYRQDVLRISFRERPPSREEQEKQLDTGCSLARVAGVVAGFAFLISMDGLLVYVSTDLCVISLTLCYQCVL